MKDFVKFSALSNGTIVALCGNLDAITVDAEKFDNYMEKMLDITGGTKVEFNNTFRDFCKDRVFYTYENLNDNHMDFIQNPYVPTVVECVLLTDNRVVMNIDGTIVVNYPEDGNLMFKTKEDAEESAKAETLEKNQIILDYLFAARKSIKEKLNQMIDKHLDFKKEIHS